MSFIYFPFRNTYIIAGNQILKGQSQPFINILGIRDTVLLEYDTQFIESIAQSISTLISIDLENGSYLLCVCGSSLIICSISPEGKITIKSALKGIVNCKYTL